MTTSETPAKEAVYDVTQSRVKIQYALSEVKIPSQGLRRPELNIAIEKELTARGWTRQPVVTGDREDIEMEAELDFIKERVEIEVAFSH